MNKETGQTNGRQKNRLIENRQSDKCKKDNQTDEQKKTQTNGQTDNQTNLQKYNQTNLQKDIQTVEKNKVFI